MGIGIIFAVLWFILMIVVVVAVIIGVIYLIRYLTGRGPNKQDEAMEILRQRYARGEITEQEYEEMKEKLKR